MKSVVLIGSGNVATCLGHAFKESGLEIKAVFSRNTAHAETLAEAVGGFVAKSISAIPADADLYLLAVNDASIREISETLDVKGIVVHCSGVTPMTVLAKHPKHGVMYPVQTFTKHVIPDFSQIPVCIEGNTDEVVDALKKVAVMFTNRIANLDSEKRERLHLAAVFANNFTNHLYVVASKILEQADISFELLHPLIAETARKIQEIDPSNVQTGPAIRNDQETISRHLEMLAEFPEYKDLYLRLSASITHQHRK